MQFVSVRELRLKPGSVWQRLKVEHDLIVTSKGRPMGVLCDTSGLDVEVTLRAIRRARAQAAIAQMREHARHQGLDRMTMGEIDKLIHSTRRRRKR